jgi:aminoglycoside 2'-N-acetyltransferase I
VVAEVDGVIVAHASVVERPLEIDARPVRAGYVEAVGTAPGRQGRGHGSAVMRAIGEVIAATYDLGALSTSSHAFYERLGWERWTGRTGVRTDSGLVLTPEDDDGIMILRTPTTPAIDPAGTLTCDWREGDVW